jgi:hypothetical protein
MVEQMAQQGVRLGSHRDGDAILAEFVAPRIELEAGEGRDAVADGVWSSDREPVADSVIDRRSFVVHSATPRAPGARQP